MSAFFFFFQDSPFGHYPRRATLCTLVNRSVSSRADGYSEQLVSGITLWFSTHLTNNCITSFSCKLEDLWAISTEIRSVCVSWIAPEGTEKLREIWYECCNEFAYFFVSPLRGNSPSAYQRMMGVCYTRLTASVSIVILKFGGYPVQQTRGFLLKPPAYYWLNYWLFVGIFGGRKL